MGTKAFASLIYALEENPNLDLTAYIIPRKRKSKRKSQAREPVSCDPEIVQLVKETETAVKQADTKTRVGAALE